MLSLSESFEEKLKFPAGREGFVVLGESGRRRQHPMHRHAELEFNFVARGTARYLLGDRRYDLRPQSLVWLFPAQDHILLDRSPDYAHWIVVFRPEFVAHLCRRTPASPLTEANPPGYFCRRLHDANATRLETLLTEIRDISTEKTDLFNAGLSYILQSAWAAYQSADDTAAEGRGNSFIHPAVERAVRLLRAPNEDALMVAQIAERCGLSSDHLARLFREQTGWSMVAFRNRERIRRFLDAYGHGNGTTLLDAALTAGFGSYPQFHRVFKEIMGVSPAQFRRNRRPTR